MNYQARHASDGSQRRREIDGATTRPAPSSVRTIEWPSGHPVPTLRRGSAAGVRAGVTTTAGLRSASEQPAPSADDASEFDEVTRPRPDTPTGTPAPSLGGSLFPPLDPRPPVPFEVHTHPVTEPPDVALIGADEAGITMTGSLQVMDADLLAELDAQAEAADGSGGQAEALDIDTFERLPAPPTRRGATAGAEAGRQSGASAVDHRPAESVAAPQAKKDSVGRSSLTMAAGTLASRLLGQVRMIMQIAAIGTIAVGANAFDVANKLPNNLNSIIAAGVLNAVLVPQIVKAARNKDGGRAYTDKLLTIAGVLLLGLTVLATLAAPVFTMLYTNVNADQRALTTALAYWCIPEVFFYGLYALLGQVLNARKIFGPYMWAPVFNNIVSIIGFGAFIYLFGGYNLRTNPQDVPWWTPERINLLGATALAGIAAQAIVLIVPLWRSGFRWRPSLKLRGIGLRSAGNVALWTFAAVGVGQIGFMLVSQVMSAAGDVTCTDPVTNAQISCYASNAAWTAAFTIFMLPHALVTVSVATAIFTRLSANAATGSFAKVRADLSFGMRVVALFTIIATAGMLVLAYPLSATLSFKGVASTVQPISYVVMGLSFGLTAIGFWTLYQRVFYAFEDARTLFFIQVPMAVIFAGGAWLGKTILDPKWWTAGAAVAQSLSNIFGAAAAVWVLRLVLKRIDGGRVLSVMVRAVIAALAAAAAGWLALRPFGDLTATGLTKDVAALLVGGIVMVGVYVGVLYVLRVAELLDAIAIVKRRLKIGHRPTRQP